MKRLGLVLMSVALVLGMAQCKKNVEPVSEGVVPGVSDGEIVLRLVGESSKLAVFPETGAVYYTAGDVIHVASGGTYCGTLTYHSDDDGGYFSGSLTSSTPSSGAKMYFYFMGNKDLNEDSPTSSISVNISDQTENYPVIACGESVEGYGETTEYHATMKNKCALVKFDVESSASPTTPTLIGGMNNVITFTFAGDGVGTPTTGTVGSIKLPGDSGERWAVLLKQDAVSSSTKKYIENSKIVTLTHSNIPAINDNDYLSSGIGVTVATEDFPEGAIQGLFTINEDGDQVLFSQGNLQYIGSAATPYWKFADHQYDYFGDNGQHAATENLDRDLFGWGTSGYNHGAAAYQPWSRSVTAADYYAYGSSTGNLYDGDGTADWGYNAISNGGNAENSGWRTPTTAEWEYIFNSRNSSGSYSYTKATLTLAKAEYKGVIIFPDGWTSTTASELGVSSTINFKNSLANYTSSISETDWTKLEAAGCVFLPAPGIWLAESSIAYVGSFGCYWSSSYHNANSAYYVRFKMGTFDQLGNTRYHGYSVRLVRVAQ